VRPWASANSKILRDAEGFTPLDYARSNEIFELTRDYVERLYPRQGLTLVHFSAQPEPFLTQPYTLNIP